MDKPIREQAMSKYVLPGSLTVRTVKDVHQAILEMITNSEPLTLEAHDVEEVDTAGLQMLAALLSPTASIFAAVTLKDASHELQSTAAMVGLAIPEP